MIRIFSQFRAVLLFWFALLPFVGLAGPTINYQGRITSGGTNFTGTGYFKFVLVSTGQPIWSNDGTSGGPNFEPTGVVTNGNVNNGLFNIELGSMSSGMQTIHPTIFHNPGITLRTWFSTNGSAFELLAPDVAIYSVNLASIDTGRMLVFDQNGRADFSDLQEAINVIATNFNYDGILLMSSWYQLSAPLTFPTNRQDYLLRGICDRQAVNIVNTDGACIVVPPQGARFENISFWGNPAISDTVSDPGYRINARNCAFERYSGAGPAVTLTKYGDVQLFDCDLINTNPASDTVYLSGGIQFIARDCDFHVWTANDSSNPNGNALVLDATTAWAKLDGCELGEDMNAGYSLVVKGFSEQSPEFKNCNFVNVVLYTNGFGGGDFTGCSFGDGISLNGISSEMRFNECSFRASQGKNPVRFVDCGGNSWFRNCDMFMQSNSTFYVQDSTGEIRIKDSEIHANDASAMELAATAGFGDNNWVGASLYQCRLLSSKTSATDMDCIVLTNAPGNSMRGIGVGITLTRSQVSGDIRDGVRCNEGGGIACNYSDISASRDAVTITYCGIDAFYSSISGNRHGIYAVGLATITAQHCGINGGSEGSGINGDAIHYEGGGWSGDDIVFLADSWVGAEGPDPDQARGLFANISGSADEKKVNMFRTTIGSTGPGIESASANIHASHCMFYSENRSPAFLKTTNTIASFTGCDFFGMWGGNTNAAILLYGTNNATDPAPVPWIWNSTIQSLDYSTNAPYAINIAGGITTGNVSMINSVLNTNLNPNVGIVPAGTTLINGNVIK